MIGFLALAVTVVLVVGVLAADKFGEAETIERRNPGVDCDVVLDGVWLDVECTPVNTGS